MGNGEYCINRSGLFIISFQLEGLCDTLHAIVPKGLEPGEATVALLKKLQNDLVSLSAGFDMEKMPDIDASLGAKALLAAAQELRDVVRSLLSADQASARKQDTRRVPALSQSKQQQE